MPALATSTSGGPPSMSVAAVTAAATPAASRTSATTCAPSSRSMTATAAPRSASRRVVAAPIPGEPAREEAELQELLAGRLRSAGAEVDLWEPSADEMAGRPLVPPGLDFDGRPQLVARFPGAGSGRRLMLNGHIDVVSGEPVDAWTSHPFRPEVRDRKLYGRGACDMKGGVACTVFAAEVLAGVGIVLQWDLLGAAHTDEESSGAGGSAIVAHGITAHAGIVAEPTG